MPISVSWELRPSCFYELTNTHFKCNNGCSPIENPRGSFLIRKSRNIHLLVCSLKYSDMSMDEIKAFMMLRIGGYSTKYINDFE